MGHSESLTANSEPTGEKVIKHKFLYENLKTAPNKTVNKNLKKVKMARFFV
jgi:hypothetical protein